MNCKSKGIQSDAFIYALQNGAVSAISGRELEAGVFTSLTSRDPVACLLAGVRLSMDDRGLGSPRTNATTLRIYCYLLNSSHMGFYTKFIGMPPPRE